MHNVSKIYLSEADMKLAIIGSRNLNNLMIDEYIPSEACEIVSGGARGIDALAKDYAHRKNIKITEFLPKYELYGRGAPIKRNEEIAAYADQAIAFWDGRSRGTASTIKFFEKAGKKVTVVIIEQKDTSLG